MRRKMLFMILTVVILMSIGLSACQPAAAPAAVADHHLCRRSLSLIPPRSCYGCSSLWVLGEKS